MTGAVEPSLVVLAAGLARRYGGCKPLAPIGPRGEAVIDLLASDALEAGFERIVLVLHPETGPAVRYHIEHVWPDWVEVAFAIQRVPLGTVHAVLAARGVLGSDVPFAVANADDIYGVAAMAALVDHIRNGPDEHALVGYHLRDTVATRDPVTRGICEVGPDGRLVSLTERRKIARLDGGARFVSEDGQAPEELDGGVTTSVNLWGFRAAIWATFERAMEASGLDEDALSAAGTAPGATPAPPPEVLLPEAVARAVAASTSLAVRVVPTEARLIGVTHAADVPLMSAELAREVASGVRPPATFASGGNVVGRS